MRSNLQAADDVIGELIGWHKAGLRAALVTLIGIDGNTPRPLGAQMAVCEDGRSTGYLSGGCFEQTVATEAQDVIRDGRNRLVRYGKGSAYLDLTLPCGSGLDLYFDQGIDASVLARIADLRNARQAYAISTDLSDGKSGVISQADAADLRTGRDGEFFTRVSVPQVRVLLVGGGPSLAALAHLIAAADFELFIATPDDAARGDIERLGHEVLPLASAAVLDTSKLDRWSAAICAFHEHDWEAPVLARILKTQCFYAGVLGSKTAHANRILRLKEMGVSAEDLARVRAPIGMIPGAKSRVTLAAGVLAELTAEAKTLGMIA